MIDVSWDIECDVLVVGSGAGALTSALTAHDGGANVLIVEKSDHYGGTSAMSGGGVWVPNNHYLQAAGGDDSYEDGKAYMKSVIGNSVEEMRIDAYLTKAPEMLRYLDDNSQVQFRAMPYPDYFPEKEGGKKGYRTLEPLPTHANALGADFDTLNPPHHQVVVMDRFCIDMFEGRAMLTQAKGSMIIMMKIIMRYFFDIKGRLKGKRDRRITMGGALVARLKASLNDRGLNVSLNTGLTELIKDGDQVIGAIVKQGETTQQIKVTKGVILGAGGFEQNQAMRDKYLPGPTNTLWSGGNSANTGDAIRAGQNIGAKTDLMDAAWWAPSIHVPGEPRARILFAERSLPGNVIVDKNGMRFTNEALPYLESGYSMYKAGCVPAYMIFDADFREKYPLGPLMPGRVQSDKQLPSKVNEILFKADTLGELAEKIVVDAKGLQATIDRNNEYARIGKDIEHGRGNSYYDQYYGDQKQAPNPCIAPIAKAPFYAMAIYPGDIGTKGGLSTNNNAQVLGCDGQVINGLYAIGNSSASVMGRAYPGAGSTLGPAMTFGYVAGRHVTGNV